MIATEGRTLRRYLEVPTEGHRRALARPYPNTQGFQVQVSPNERATLLRVQALSETLDRVDPVQIVLQFSATPLPNLDAVPPRVNTRPVVELRWGCGGGTHEAIFDVGQGTTIQLAADAIDAAAVYLQPGGGIVPPPGALGPPLLFRCTAVYGSKGYAQSAPTTTFTDPFTFDPALPALGVIPPWAKSVNLLLTDPAPLRAGAQSFTLEASPDLSFLAPARFTLGGPEYPGRYAVPWALLPDARFVRVTTTGGVAVPGWLVYDLAL